MNKKLLVLFIGVAVVVGLVAGLLLYGGSPSSTTQPLKAGAGFSNTPDVFTGGAQLGDSVVTTKVVQITSGQQFVSWTNGSGKTIYIDRAEFSTDGTASSSQLMFVGTSSTATLAGGPGLSIYTDGGLTGIYASGTAPDVAKNLPFAGILDDVVIATSTVATTTSNGVTDIRKEPDVTDRVIAVADGVSVYALLISPNDNPDTTASQACNSVGNGGLGENCESATSTNRGFSNVTVRFGIHY